MAKDSTKGNEVRIKDIPPRDLTADQAKDVKGGRKVGDRKLKLKNRK